VPLLLVVPLALLLLVLLPIVLMPISLAMRYRTGTARREARGWVAVLNLATLGISTALFLTVAAVTTYWVPNALRYSAMGLCGGLLLGILGLYASRWEAGGESLHYTPSRLIVLALLTAVAARIAFGFWRGWHAWQARPDDVTWLAASGAAGSMAVGALVLGYYFAYWWGVRGRLQAHRARRL
jgi:hypothetical protein